MDISRGYAPWKGGPNDRTATLFGGADIDYHSSQGKSGQEMLDYVNANPSKMKSAVARAQLMALVASEKKAAESSSGDGNNYSPVPITSKPYAPGDIFDDNPGSESNEFSYEDFLADREKRQAAKDLAEMYAQNSDGDLISTVNVDQNVGSFKNFDNSVIGNDNDLQNVGNDYSFNQGQLKLVNAPFGIAGSIK